MDQWRRSVENIGEKVWVGTGEAAGGDFCLPPRHPSKSVVPRHLRKFFKIFGQNPIYFGSF